MAYRPVIERNSPYCHGKPQYWCREYIFSYDYVKHKFKERRLFEIRYAAFAFEFYHGNQYFSGFYARTSIDDWHISKLVLPGNAARANIRVDDLTPEDYRQKARINYEEQYYYDKDTNIIKIRLNDLTTHEYYEIADYVIVGITENQFTELFVTDLRIRETPSIE